MSRSRISRFLGVLVISAFGLAIGGCGTNYDGVTQQEAQPVLTLLEREGLGDLVADRLEGKKLKDNLLIIRTQYHAKSDGQKMELMFRLEDGKITGRGFNKFGNDWRSHGDELLAEFK